MRQIYIFIVFVLTAYAGSAQVQTIRKNCGDLENASILQANRTYTFSNSPSGFGLRQEFPKNPYRASFVFKEEQNTVWFLMPITSNGTLTFEITPKSPKDDFDWMIYKYTYKLRNEIARDVARPLRSNISRNDGTVSGKTGMRDGFQNNYAVAGPGRSFSKPLDVRKGDTLAIIVDNIYDKGSGFSLTTNLSYKIPLLATIKGKVIGADTKLPLSGAKIICEDDSTGMLLSQTTVNANGDYTISAPLNRPVNLVARHPDYIFATEDLEIAQKSETVNFNLLPVVTGNKAVMFNIHFARNQDLILANSNPDINRLVEFLNAHPQFDIRIVGHTNNNPFEDPRFLQKLSFNRAIAVKKRLILGGIPEDRLACMGLGGKTPITQSKVYKEAMKNLRVEIELKLREMVESE